MKKHLLTLGLLFFFLVGFAGKFVFIPVCEPNNLEALFNHNDLKIHYYCDDYVLATTNNLDFKNLVVLDENAFTDVDHYAIVYCIENQKNDYLKKIAGSVKTLHSGENFFIMKLISDGFVPAKNDGIVKIRNTEASLPKTRFVFPVITEIDPFIQSLTEKVSTDTLISYVQHLQDFGTRAYDEPQAYQAQYWLQSKFESWGLNTEIQNVVVYDPYWWIYDHTNSSGNVIALQPGTVYPEKYIVCGAHYDSWSWYPISATIAPGADDNATGTATVLEMARILSEYQFEYSIIYCCFAAEEFGLYGSEAYALKCNQQDMNIIGYFNIDMSGYLKPETPMHISLIYPSTATPLANYLINVANYYIPSVPITSYPNLSGGDSDHTSFNQKGFMGIWTFEDWEYDSPYIHGPNDIIGPSVNNSEQVKVFTQINLASIATLAIFDEEDPPPPPPINPPTHCETEVVEGMCIKVTWKEPEEVIPIEYFVYRDSVNIAQTTELFYLDTVADYGEYCYMITAIYSEEESEFSNESCAEIVPVTHTYYPPTHCVAEYLEEMCIKVTWDAPEEGTPDEYSVYRDSVEIAKCVEMLYMDTVTDYLLHCYLVTAIYDVYESEYSEESCTQVPVKIIEQSSKFKVYPNPTTGELYIQSSKFKVQSVEIYDVFGRKVLEPPLTVLRSYDLTVLHSGIYFVKIYTEAGQKVAKLIKE